MHLIIIILSLSLSMYSQDNEYEFSDYCMEYYMGGHIDEILADSTVDLWQRVPDTAFYRFYFGGKSELFCIFSDYGFMGGPFMDIDVKNGIVERVLFYYLSVGNVPMTEEVVNHLLRTHFCITEPLIPDEENELSYCTETRHGIKISAMYLWDAGLEDVVSIEYTFIE